MLEHLLNKTDKFSILNRRRRRRKSSPSSFSFDAICLNNDKGDKKILKNQFNSGDTGCGDDVEELSTKESLKSANTVDTIHESEDSSSFQSYAIETDDYDEDEPEDIQSMVSNDCDEVSISSTNTATTVKTRQRLNGKNKWSTTDKINPNYNNNDNADGNDGSSERDCIKNRKSTLVIKPNEISENEKIVKNNSSCRLSLKDIKLTIDHKTSDDETRYLKIGIPNNGFSGSPSISSINSSSSSPSYVGNRNMIPNLLLPNINKSTRPNSDCDQFTIEDDEISDISQKGKNNSNNQTKDSIIINIDQKSKTNEQYPVLDIENNSKLRSKNSLGYARISILGEPLPLRKEVSYNRERIVIYNFLQRPKGFYAFCYHLFVIICIVLGLVLFSMSTVHHYYDESIQLLRVFDAFILALFVVEFLARCWSSSCISKYQGWFGMFRFLTSTFRLIDVFIISASAAVLWIHHVDPFGNRINVDWLRFAQAFQVLRVSYRFRPWRIMASVIWTQRDHLAIAFYMCSLSLVFVTFIVYFIEHSEPNSEFTSIPKTLWWGIVSLLTVGYGDMVPSTTTGKVLASILLLLCVSAFALPAGILGTGLALKVQEQQRQKHFNKRKDPAARLIQCAWRCYASSVNSRSTATWIACIKKPSNHNHKAGNESQTKSTDPAETSSMLGSVADLKLLRRFHRMVNESQSSLVDYNGTSKTSNNDGTSQSGTSSSPKIPFVHRVLQKTIGQLQNNENDKNYEHFVYDYFNKHEKIMIRFIRKLKLEVARRKFKNAFRPYDINDVIEQYAAGHADVVSRVKTMHSRINSIQNSLSVVMKMCQDLNYVHYHQMDRLEKSLQQLNEKLSITNDYQQKPLQTTMSNPRIIIPNHCTCRPKLSSSTSSLTDRQKSFDSSETSTSSRSSTILTNQRRFTE